MSPETSKLHPLLTISGGYKQELLQAKELCEHVCRLLSVLVVLQELCRKCIKYNASCGRAWERLGSIMEREQAYKVRLTVGLHLHLRVCCYCQEV